MPLDLNHIRQALGDEIFTSGESLAGAVSDTRQLQGGAVVTGVVNDNGCQQRVYIHLTGTEVDGECSCDVGENCAHVAAVLIQVGSPDAPAADAPKVPKVEQTGPGKRAATAVQQPPSVENPTVSPPAQNQQCVLYQLETCLLDELAPGAQPCAIDNAALIRVSLWVGQSQATGEWRCSPLSPHSLRGGFYPRYVQAADKAILPQLIDLAAEGPYPLDGTSGAELLQALLQTGCAYWGQIEAEPLSLSTNKPPRCEWQLLANGEQRLSFGLINGPLVLPLLSPCWYLDENGAGELPDAYDPTLIQQLAEQAPLAPEAVADFVRALPAQHRLPLPRELEVTQEPLVSVKGCLHLIARDDKALATLDYVYNGEVVESRYLSDDSPCVRFMRDGNLVQVERDLMAEAALPNALADFTLTRWGYSLPSKRAWLTFMMLSRESLARQGWSFEIADDFPYRMALARDWYGDLLANPLATGSDQNQDWFSLELGIFVDGEPVNILPLLVEQLRGFSLASGPSMESPTLQLDHDSEQAIDNQMMLQLGDGRYLPIPMARVQKILQTLVELYDQDCLTDDNRLRLPESQASRLAQLAREAFGDEEEAIEWRGEEALQELAERLSQFEGIEPLDPPAEFQAQLRSYQQEGLGWLQFLREFQVGGILADDMGLGKTVQTLAHLATEKAAGRLTQPALIVAPTSLMSNWRNEAAKFAPDLKVLILQGNKRKQLFDQMAEADLILTTYPLLNFDAEQLLAQDYSLLILDEAQSIKNPRAKASQVVRQLQAEHRLCLTGTPMENHLGELWALFDFLQPGLLGDERSFQQVYRGPIERDANEERAMGLAKRIAPFILRRTKEAVATELPPKTEIVRAIPIGEKQRDLYDSIRLTMHKQIRQVIKDQGFARSQIAVLDALLKLRQVCCDPRLLDLETAKGVTQSAKFDTLMEMLPELVEEGRRILLFSQFTSMLALIEEAVNALGIPCVKLTGQTKDREAVVSAFQQGDVPLFLISLKAGGTGLNLTAADTVIHYDPWWNPAAENQATDRAYRIGQDKPVFVYKLVTEGTVEEKILHLQKSKQALAAGVYGAKAGSPTRLTPEDLELLMEPMAVSENPEMEAPADFTLENAENSIF